ncbi:hypothetical protein ABZX77_34785 [Streptomyces sp. NPDC004237]|uniref:hypothetical protein n=1 Tax=Streptomyces sp. NPDC004237 TaxID=3154455 RepID=UPI0033AA4C60
MPAENAPASGGLDDGCPAPAWDGPITPPRSDGGHHRCSRCRLRVAVRARELVDQGTAIEAACRIVSLRNLFADAPG